VKELAVSETRYDDLSPNVEKSTKQPDDRVVDDPHGVTFDEFASAHRRSILQRERQSRADTVEPEV
jgi:hypothetical protein